MRILITDCILCSHKLLNLTRLRQRSTLSSPAHYTKYLSNFVFFSISLSQDLSLSPFSSCSPTILNCFPPSSRCPFYWKLILSQSNLDDFRGSILQSVTQTRSLNLCAPRLNQSESTRRSRKKLLSRMVILLGIPVLSIVIFVSSRQSDKHFKKWACFLPIRFFSASKISPISQIHYFKTEMFIK